MTRCPPCQGSWDMRSTSEAVTRVGIRPAGTCTQLQSPFWVLATFRTPGDEEVMTLAGRTTTVLYGSETHLCFVSLNPHFYGLFPGLSAHLRWGA